MAGHHHGFVVGSGADLRDGGVAIHPELPQELAAALLGEIRHRVQQVAHEGRAGGMAVLGALGQHLVEDPVPAVRQDPQHRRLHLHGRFIDDAVEDGVDGGARERRLAAHQLEDQDAEAEDVRAAVHLAFPDLLGAGVAGRAEEGPGLGEAGVFPLGDAEVHELGASVLAHHDVPGLHVPVDDALGVGVVQGLGQTRGDAELLLVRQRSAFLHQPVQGLAGHELHGQEGTVALLLAHIVDGHDAGMVQQTRDLSLPLEAQQVLVLVGFGPHRLQLHELDGHLPLDAGVLREHHAAHGPRTQEAEDLVATDGPGEVQVVEVGHASILPDASGRSGRLSCFSWFFRPSMAQ